MKSSKTSVYSLIAGVALSVSYVNSWAMEGYWEARETCVSYQDTTACDPKKSNGSSDTFSLELLVKGDLVCGYVTSTTHQGKNVDSSLVVGHVKGKEATVRFGSSFLNPTLSKELEGNAQISIEGKKLRWKVTKQPGVPGEESKSNWDTALVYHKSWGPKSCPAQETKIDGKNKPYVYAMCKTGDDIRKNLETQCENVWLLIDSELAINFWSGQ